MLYREWLQDDTINKDWMSDPDFFRGIPIETEDAPISEVMREAVYDYIKDYYGGKRISLSDPVRWGELFRARLTEVNGSFWKQMQMDQLLKIIDMVRADYSEFIQNYNRGVSDTTSFSKSDTETEYTDNYTSEVDTGPITTTTTNREATKQTTTVEPTNPRRTVSLHSELAEATYTEPAIVDGEGLAGMPILDTTHGSTASGSWELAPGSKTTVETETPTGNNIVEQSAVNQTSIEEGTGSSTGTTKTDATNKTLSAGISGTLREGHRDYDGYNLRASIESVQMLLPLNYLRQSLASLFRSANDNELWI